MLYKKQYDGYVVECPKCGRQGIISKIYVRRTKKSRWCGPYLRIEHYRSKHDPVKYRRLRKKGLTAREASQKHGKRYVGMCYLGKKQSNASLRLHG